MIPLTMIHVAPEVSAVVKLQSTRPMRQGKGMTFIPPTITEFGICDSLSDTDRQFEIPHENVGESFHRVPSIEDRP